MESAAISKNHMGVPRETSQTPGAERRAHAPMYVKGPHEPHVRVFSCARVSPGADPTQTGAAPGATRTNRAGFTDLQTGGRAANTMTDLWATAQGQGRTNASGGGRGGQELAEKRPSRQCFLGAGAAHRQATNEFWAVSGPP